MYVCMYVCMYVTVCTHLFKLTPTMCLLKMSVLKYFYRIFFLFFFFFFLIFWQGGGGGGGVVREGSIMSGLPHQFNDFQLTQSRAR